MYSSLYVYLKRRCIYINIYMFKYRWILIGGPQAMPGGAKPVENKTSCVGTVEYIYLRIAGKNIYNFKMEYS